MKAITRATVFSALLALLSNAHAAVVDFEGLAQADSGTANQGFTYSEDGFTLDNLSALQFATFGTLEPRFPGSTALFNNTGNGITRLTKTGGGAFDLDAIDLAELSSAVIANVTFVGTLAGGGSVTQTFTLDGSGPGGGLETFLFSGFANVTAVQWAQQYPFHQFDNIVINQTVPEPATLALLGIALAGLGFAHRPRAALSRG